jgi:hypothetical protein
LKYDFQHFRGQVNSLNLKAEFDNMQVID